MTLYYSLVSLEQRSGRVVCKLGVAIETVESRFGQQP